MTGRAGRRLVRTAGWLLTPVVVWAATFFGGWFGASAGGTLAALLIGGVAGALVSVLGWAALLRWLLRARTHSAHPPTDTPSEQDSPPSR